MTSLQVQDNSFISLFGDKYNSVSLFPFVGTRGASQSTLWGTPASSRSDAVSSVVEMFQEAKKQAAAFQRFIPRRHQSHGAAAKGQPQPCTLGSSYRQQQMKQHFHSKVKQEKTDLRKASGKRS